MSSTDDGQPNKSMKQNTFDVAATGNQGLELFANFLESLAMGGKENMITSRKNLTSSTISQSLREK